MVVRMMMEDDMLRTKEKSDRFNKQKYVIPVKIFGLYCEVVCKSGGKACMGGGVGSDA